MNAIVSAQLTASLDFAGLKAATANACKVVEKRNAVPIFAHMLIKGRPYGAQIIATDDDIFTSTGVHGESADGFEALVDAHRLKDILSTADAVESVNFTRDGDRLVAAIGSVNFILGHAIEVSDFPVKQEWLGQLSKSDLSFKMSGADMRRMLETVSIAISTEETRYYLNGICMRFAEHENELHFVATDGHRMVRFAMEPPAGAERVSQSGVIIPRKTATELHRLLKRKGCSDEITITVSATGVAFLVGDDVLIESKLVDGTFPDYGRVMPSRSTNRASANATKMLKALETASMAIKGSGSGVVRLNFTAGKLAFTCVDGDASTTTEVETNGTFEMEAGFNGRYLIELLKGVRGSVEIDLADPSMPARFTDSLDDRLTFVLMPLRV